MSDTRTENLCAVCGEHANEHLAIPHEFVAKSSNQIVSPAALRFAADHGGQPVLRLAADEIERLRAQLRGKTFVTDDERDREIERLRAALAIIGQAYRSTNGPADETDEPQLCSYGNCHELAEDNGHCRHHQSSEETSSIREGVSTTDIRDAVSK